MRFADDTNKSWGCTKTHGFVQTRGLDRQGFAISLRRAQSAKVRNLLRGDGVKWCGKRGGGMNGRGEQSAVTSIYFFVVTELGVLALLVQQIFRNFTLRVSSSSKSKNMPVIPEQFLSSLLFCHLQSSILSPQSSAFKLMRFLVCLLSGHLDMRSTVVK